MPTLATSLALVLAAALLVACAKPASPEAAPDAAPPVTVAAPPAKAPADCLVVDAKQLGGGPATLEGTLFENAHGHPNGSTFQFIGIELAKERCVEGLEGETTAKQVQLAPKTENEKAVKALVGKKVKVTGKIFPMHTAWHVRPVLLDVETIRPL